MALVTLRVLDGADRGRVYDSLPTPVTIGREEGNSVQLNDERISRFHLKIQEDQGKLVLTDLGSTNGTLVNDVPISGEYVLHDGDLIRMGHSEWAFHSVYSSGPSPRVQARQPVAMDHEPAYAARVARPPTRTQPRDIVDSDELPWSAIAIVVGGLIIGFSICCIAAVFILSR